MRWATASDRNTQAPSTSPRAPRPRSASSGTTATTSRSSTSSVALVRNDLAELHELCVMPTHYHLLGTFRERGLSDAIHRLNRRYASGFNRRHGRRGKVFDSPFGAVEVQDDVHDRWLDIYLAENPPRRPWPWSSADAEVRVPHAAALAAGRTSRTWFVWLRFAPERAARTTFVSWGSSRCDAVEPGSCVKRPRHGEAEPPELGSPDGRSNVVR